jgi:hypothetical protein
MVDVFIFRIITQDFNNYCRSTEPDVTFAVCDVTQSCLKISSYFIELSCSFHHCVNFATFFLKQISQRSTSFQLDSDWQNN